MKQPIAILMLFLILLTFLVSCSIATSDAESTLKSESGSTTGIDSTDTTTVDDELIPKHPHDNENIDEKLASEIKKAYIIEVYNKLEGSDRNPLNAENITVQVYVNTTAGKNFVMIGDGRFHTDAMRYVKVAGYTLPFGSSQLAYVYESGKFYTISEAYERELISKEDVYEFGKSALNNMNGFDIENPVS